MGKRSILPKEEVICDECQQKIQGWFSIYILPMRNFVCFTCYFKYLTAIRELAAGKKVLHIERR